MTFLFLGLVVVPQQLKNVEVFFFKVNLLLVQTVGHNLRLLADWLRSSVDFLEDHLHHGCLELGQHVHLVKCLLGLAFHLLLGHLTG